MRLCLVNLAKIGVWAIFMCVALHVPAWAMMPSDAEPESTFLERHWWEFLAFFFLCATGFAHSDEDRTAGKYFYFILAFIFLMYCLHKNYAPHWQQP